MLFFRVLQKTHVIRPVNEWRAIALACTHTRQYLFGYAIFARGKLYLTG